MKLAVALLFLLQVILQESLAVTFRNPGEGTPTNLLVTDAGVLITVLDKLIVVDVSNFSHLRTYDGYDSARSSIAKIAAVDEEVVVCLYSSSSVGRCSIQADYLNCNQQDNCIIQESDYFAFREARSCLTRVSNYFYFAGTGDREMVFGYFQHIDYDSFDAYPSVGTARKRITAENFNSRGFFYNFFDDGYVYFIALDSFGIPEMSKEIKLMRMCHINNMSSVVDLGSMFEIKLDCGFLSDNTTIVSYFKIDQKIILGLNDGNRSRLCIFNLTDIDIKIAQAFSWCSIGSYEFQLPWLREMSRCRGFKQNAVSECLFQIPNSLPAVSGVHQSVIAADPETGITLFSTTQPMLAAALVEVDEINYVYIAQGISGYQRRGTNIVKYLLSEDGLSLRELLVYAESSSVLLLSSGGPDFVYGASSDVILRLDVDSCSSYTTCTSCAGSGDPLCGWCTLEGTCSRHTSCRHGGLRSRWIQDDQMCLTSHFEWEKGDMPLDNLQPLKVSFGSANASFPELTGTENYVCVGYLSETQLRFPLVQFQGDSYCNISAGDIPQNLHYKIDLWLSIEKTDGSEVFITFPPSESLAIYNCSKSQRCRECELFPQCGWCPFKGRCTGRASECIRESYWINKREMNSETLCPLILPALEQSYYVYVATAVNISLNAKNILPLVNNTQYVCKMEYHDGRSVFTSAYTNRDTQVICQIEKDQIGFSSITNHAEESLTFSVWANSSNGGMHQIEYFDFSMGGGFQYDGIGSGGEVQSPAPSAGSMVIYNCSVLTESCSLCTGSNSEGTYDCFWCSVTGQTGSTPQCTTTDECATEGSFLVTINSSTNCYADPEIRSVSPMSGPIGGGTAVAITGIDLGGSRDHIEVKIGSFDCILEDYSIGRRIQCLSPNSSGVVGPLPIVVKVLRRRGFVNAIFGNENDGFFHYALPEVTGNSPGYGPLSGGTHIILRGSSFNISDMIYSTTVEVGAVPCAIQKITYSEIHCVSPALISTGDGANREKSVLLSIDRTTVYGGKFKYTENPRYHSVQPQFIIPAGGISIIFNGEFLNSSSQPRLVVSIGNDSYHSNSCISSGNHSLRCVTPKLPTLLEVVNTHVMKRSRGGESGLPLTYTVVQDGAPGPNTTIPSLALFLRENPVFVEIDEDERVYLSSSGDPILISGTNLDSVNSSEIRVTLLGEECMIIDVNAVVLKCIPPDFPLTQDRDIEVMVSVGNGSLTYSAGSIRFLRNVLEEDQTVLSRWMPIILGCGIILVVLVLLLCLMGIICILCIKKRNRIVAIEHQDVNIGPYPHNMQKSTKSASLEQSHEENLYELIPGECISDSVQCQNSHPPPILPNKRSSFTNSTPEGNSNKFVLPNTMQQNTIVTSNQTTSDEYVSMSSHRVSSNLTPPDEVAESERKEALVNSLEHEAISSAEYVDMQPSDEVSTHKKIQLYPSSTLC